MKSGTMAQHSFATVPRAEIQRSRFNRSFNHKTTFNAGLLLPVMMDEVLPGDTMNLTMTHFARLATPIAPIMDNLYLDSFFFFVPSRIIWDNFQKFMGEQRNPGDSTDYLIPQVEFTNIQNGTLADHFALPTQLAGKISVNSLPFRAYQTIWNEWFRDQNLQDSVDVPYGDGPDNAAVLGQLQRRGKRHDYFTSALPWPQKGPAVTLPLGTTAPVVGIAEDITLKNGANQGPFVTTNDGGIWRTQISGVATVGNVRFGDQTGLEVDLSESTSATINALRQAFQLQRFFEKDARGGTRYTEIIKSHFGVTSPDARLQRPEYLGGGSTKVGIHPVTQQSASTDDSPQGNMAGFGVTSGSHGFTRSFTEHGYIIGLVSVRADLNYQQGINRAWSRRTRPDFYWPTFSHLGEQAILTKEIYAEGDVPGSTDDTVFGYIPRYDEYRFKPSTITGQFRSNYAQSLDFWHLAQDFADTPTLSEAFIQENPPMSRIVALPSQPDFIFDSYFNYICARPMPANSVPGLIDHF